MTRVSPISEHHSGPSPNHAMVGILAALLALSGCYTSHLLTPYEDAAGVQERQSFDTSPPFRYEKAELPFTNHVVGQGATANYELRLLEMPSFGDNGQVGNRVTARYYRSRLTGPRPLVIVMPIWGTYTYPPRKTAASIQRLSEGAVHVLYVQGDDYLADWTGLVAAADKDEFLDLWRQAVERQKSVMINISRLIDWAEDRPEINGERVGLIGFSLSAIVAGVIATQEPRLAAVVTVMGGSHLETVIATCDGKRARSVQAKAVTSFGWDRNELESRLEPIFAVLDSANYPDRVDPRRVLIIDAKKDQCVPEVSREDLWKALGKPERITLNYDHAPAFLAMTPVGNNWLRRQIWDFFEARLLE